MRTCILTAMAMGAAGLSLPAAASADDCTTETARPAKISEIFATPRPADCLIVSGIAWKGRLYPDIAAIYAELRGPVAGQVGHRLGYQALGAQRDQPMTLSGDMTMGELALQSERLRGFEGRARRISATGKVDLFRMGAPAGGSFGEAWPFHPPATALKVVVHHTAIDAAHPVDRLIAANAPPEAISLSPLGADSPWLPRFSAAADELLPALQSGKAKRWQALMGGKWMSEADRKAVAAQLRDPRGVFASIVDAKGPVSRVILGWRPPTMMSQAERDGLAQQPTAEAIVCWSTHRDAERLWPIAAFDADNRAGRPYACARITHSIGGGAPQWRAFIEKGPGGLDEPA